VSKQINMSSVHQFLKTCCTSCYTFNDGWMWKCSICFFIQ